ncbi:MAG: hypothetical protein WKF78_08780 [Candidatus Limnocylindrales bacterium]
MTASLLLEGGLHLGPGVLGDPAADQPIQLLLVLDPAAVVAEPRFIDDLRDDRPGA